MTATGIAGTEYEDFWFFHLDSSRRFCIWNTLDRGRSGKREEVVRLLVTFGCPICEIDKGKFLTQSKRMKSLRSMSDPVELLREHKVPVTAQRLAVLRAVSGRPHSTADAIATDVRAEIGSISRQAVYNVLGVLTDKGLIRRIQPAGSSALYEDRVGDNHHHLICRSCGTTVDVDCAVGDTPCLNAANDSGFIIDEAEVLYWGTCPECQKGNSSAKNSPRKNS